MNNRGSAVTYPKAIVISTALIAATVVFAAYQPAYSVPGSGGRYILGDNVLTKSGHVRTWVIDTQTGELRLCQPAESDPISLDTELA